MSGTIDARTLEVATPIPVDGEADTTRN